MRLLEEENWDRSDVVLYPSVEEREYVRQARPDCVVDQVPMLGYTPRELRLGRTSLDHFAARNADDLVFVGGAHPPNVAALTWFVSEVLPAVVAMRPETKLHIVGSVTGGLESDFASDSIVWRGRLSDDELRDLYATAGVAIIPLRFGGGVKGKTIEALFHGIPLVATPVGMQGLAPTEPIGLVAWEAIDFADAILNAQSDRAGARERTVRGLEFIDSHYSIEAMRRTFAGYLPVLNELPQLEMAEGALH
jgi:glycosyltransferase involved in cell wall biosynthesis